MRTDDAQPERTQPDITPNGAAADNPLAAAPVRRADDDALHRLTRILAVADCTALDEIVQDMRWHGFDVTPIQAGAHALAAYEDYDVVLLDVELPDIDGLAICRAIREVSDIPIIGFVSGSSELNHVLSLEAGCDDCMEKPYRSRELVARINAILRRTRAWQSDSEEDAGQIRRGSLRIDAEAREAHLDGRPLQVTRKEFDLLHLLAAQPDKVFSRDELMTEIWEHPSDLVVSSQASRTIDTHVSSLRSKLGDGGWITTVRGVGFRFGGDS